jgi:hypothetical protein
VKEGPAGREGKDEEEGREGRKRRTEKTEEGGKAGEGRKEGRQAKGLGEYDFLDPTLGSSAVFAALLPHRSPTLTSVFSLK